MGKSNIEWTAKTLETLARVHYEYRRKANTEWDVMSWEEHEHDYPRRHREYLDATAAILRAARPRVEVTEHDLYNLAKNGDIGPGAISWLNSRIRFGVELPEESSSNTGQLPEVPLTVGSGVVPLTVGVGMSPLTVGEGVVPLTVSITGTPSAAPTDAHIEALAQVLKKEYDESSNFHAITNAPDPDELGRIAVREWMSAGLMNVPFDALPDAEKTAMRCMVVAVWNHGRQENQALLKDVATHSDNAKHWMERAFHWGKMYDELLEKYKRRDAQYLEATAGEQREGTRVCELEAECDDLRRHIAERATRPVKVRFDVDFDDLVSTACDESGWTFHEGRHASEYTAAVKNILADHAVIDVPPGVPSVRELATTAHSVYRQYYNGHYPMLEDSERVAAAIRDAVLAAVPVRLPDREELAKAIDKAYESVAGGDYFTQWHQQTEPHRERHRIMADAALAMFRERNQGAGECPKCVLNRQRLDQSERMSDKRHAICHRYEQDIKKAHAILSAALEGEA